MSGLCVALPHVCQASGPFDSFCQALITNQREERGARGWGAGDNEQNRAVGGGAKVQLCVNRLID